MNPAILRNANRAFTLIELLVVVVIIGVLIAMLAPAHTGRPKARNLACMSNLRQIGIGLLLYASDHRDQFPWQISTNSAVSREAVESRPASEHFAVLTNSLPLATFVCPTDKARATATNYSDFDNANLSYFVALSTTMMNGSNAWRLILAGDRHLSADGRAVKPGLCTLNDKSVPGWTKALHPSDNNLTRGSLLFADSHAQFVPAKDLPKVFKDQSVTASRLVVP